MSRLGAEGTYHVVDSRTGKPRGKAFKRLEWAEAAAHHLTMTKGWKFYVARVTSHPPSRDAGIDKKALWKDIDKDLKVKERTKLQSLRANVSRAALEDKAQCRIAKEHARKRTLLLRERAARFVRQVRWQIAWERLRAEQKCRGAGSAKSAREALLEERRYQASLRRSKAASSKKGPSVHKASAPGAESDEEVRQNLPAELIPMFNRVKRGIKGSSRMSRTEAFLKYAEEHPKEAYEGVEAATESLIADLERQQRAGRRDVARGYGYR